MMHEIPIHITTKNVKPKNSDKLCFSPRYRMTHADSKTSWSTSSILCLPRSPPHPHHKPKRHHHPPLLSSDSSAPFLTDSNVYSAIKTQPIKGNVFRCQKRGPELQGERL